MSTINVTNLSGRGGATPNLPDGANITGVATATSFDGNLKSTGTPTLGLGVTINASGLAISGVATAGIGSFTTIYGDGSNMTGVGESIAPWHYNPDINDTLATVDTGIGITFNKKVVAGSGTATLKIVNAGVAGTTIQSWGVSSATYNVTQFSLDSLVSDLTIRQTYQVDIPATFIDDAAGSSYVGTAWTFTAQDSQGKYWVLGGQAAYGSAGPTGMTPSQQFSSPVQIWGTVEDWDQLTNNSSFTNVHHQLSINKDKELWSWGYNSAGQLGQNSVVNYSSPVQIPGTTWAMTSKGYYSSFGLKTDGTLWSWGNNTYGQLATNSAAPVKLSSPTQIPGTTWSSIAGGHYQNAAIKTDGTMWTWGTNTTGSLGLNDVTRRSSPTQVPGTTWSKITFGHEEMMAAIKTNGTLWAWGKNARGQLGQNNRIEYSSPVQIGSGTDWANLNGGKDNLMAVKTDGTLWGLGNDDKGQLGQNSVKAATTGYSSPVQIPGTTWATGDRKMIMGYKSTYAIKTDGTLWDWGENEYGQLGHNSRVKYSSPVQVLSSISEWKNVDTSMYITYALQDDESP